MASALEAVLENLPGSAPRELPPCPSASRLEVLARCQGLSPKETPRRSGGEQQTRVLADEESEGEVDIEVLVECALKSLTMLKKLAERA
ncbi:hypothetical protein Taro_006658 [Colocasia esculenta]|uniref:Uncharacterized protein n=1 Tax=Colocasia esculenta TaxID=4460 RepID=A0A843TXL9_COLES|nr:hypothetical protein [Colocasia esculenta]